MFFQRKCGHWKDEKEVEDSGQLFVNNFGISVKIIQIKSSAEFWK